ncbi:MAG: hypothetical protein LBN06_06075 [Prevotellaceae bacterium]|jgi:hypothetical protein|nr:hypothetical protein [Prevotellaceae bacterium]
MKNLIWMIAGIALTSLSFTFAACGNAQATREAILQDSLRQSDSLAAVAQMAKHDSIARADSIKTEQKKPGNIRILP